MRRGHPLVIGIVAAVAALGAFVAVVAVAADDDGAPEAEAVLTFDAEDDESGIDDLIGGDATGDAPPAASFTLLEGGTMRFADLRGTPIVVNFFASWCAPCVAEMPDFEAVHQEVGAEVTFVGIALRDSVDAARQLVEDTGVTYTVGRDPSGELFQAFEGLNMPSTYFISAEGVVVDSRLGAMDAAELRERIEKHLR